MKKIILIIILGSLSACDQLFEVGVPESGKIQDYHETRPIETTFADLKKIIEQKSGQSSCLNPPATTLQIAEAERKTGQEFPENMKKLYLIANGQNQDPKCISIFIGYSFMPLQNVIYEWQQMYDLTHGDPEFETLIEVQGAVNAYGWHIKWIPIGSAGNGDLMVLDYIPADKGRTGQIVEFIHDDLFRPHLGTDINSYLGRMENEIRMGKLIFNTEWHVFEESKH